MRKTVILGTIINKKRFPYKTIRDIVDILGASKIFVFFDAKESRWLLTYNLDKELIGIKLPELTEKYKNTFRLHRKKKNNVFFTINAIEALEKENENFNWNNYSNCLFLTDKGEVKKFDLALEKIINLKEKEYYERFYTKSRSHEAKTRKEQRKELKERENFNP